MPRGVQSWRAKARSAGREIQYKDGDMQVYGTVAQLLGNGRVSVECDDGIKRVCRIRGSMRKREWIHAGNVVLVSLRDDATDKGDVIFRYTDAEVVTLRRVGEYVMLEKDEDNNDVEIFFEDPDAI